MSQESLFRKKALQAYYQQNQTTVLPHFVSLRLVAFLWGVLALCVGVACASWLVRIPSYVTISGIVQAQPGDGIVLFLPVNEAAHVQQGTLAQVQIGTDRPVFSATVAAVVPGVISPDVARQRYGLGSSAWGVITEPSIALIIHLASGNSEQVQAGSVVSAQVQVGSSSIFTLFPGLNSRAGGQ